MVPDTPDVSRPARGQSLTAETFRAETVKRLRRGGHYIPADLVNKPTGNRRKAFETVKASTIAKAEREWAVSARLRSMQADMRQLCEEVRALDLEIARITYRASEYDEIDGVHRSVAALASAIGSLRRAARERAADQSARIIERAGAIHA